MLFESYNARFLELRDIGETFVLRDDVIASVVHPENTLIVGPRGSGKTTLLRMLKIGARLGLKDKHYRLFKNVSYTPVYIGMDRQFALKAGLSDESKPVSPAIDILTRALVTVRVKYAFLDSLQEITDEETERHSIVSHHYVRMLPTSEREFCRLLCKAWSVEADAQTVIELRAYLLSAIDRINRLVTSVQLGVPLSELMEDIVSIPSDPVHTAQSFIGTFNDFFSDSRRAWALCVDELEIMPANLQEYFFSRLRSINGQLFLKLATSPYSRAVVERSAGIDGPANGNDFSTVDLNKRTSNTDKFTRRLVARQLERHGLPPSIRLEDLLGHSPVVGEGGEEGPPPYRSPNGEHYQRFARLYNIDRSFRAYIDRNGVDLEALDDMSEGSKAGKVRKAIWQVALRNYFGPLQPYRTKGQRGYRSHSLKTLPQIYTGAESIVVMCEGNPRMIIGIFRQFIDHIASHRGAHGRLRAMTPAAQNQTIEQTIAKYLSFISSIPIKERFRERDDASAVTLLEVLGQYFAQRNLVEDFSAEPVSSFTVDRNASDAVVEAIGAAMNQGAFVVIGGTDTRETEGQIRGARMRLSYLLCPKYKLPLTIGRDVELSTALEFKRSRRTQPISMDDLFYDL